jgi:hypothetical protein
LPDSCRLRQKHFAHKPTYLHYPINSIDVRFI